MNRKKMTHLTKNFKKIDALKAISISSRFHDWHFFLKFSHFEKIRSIVKFFITLGSLKTIFQFRDHNFRDLYLFAVQ